VTHLRGHNLLTSVHGTAKRRMHSCVRLCRRSCVPQLLPRSRGHDSRHNFRRYRYRVSHFRRRRVRTAFRAECVIYARIIRERVINHSSRPVTALVSSSLLLYSPNRTRLHDEYSVEGGSFSRERMH